MTLLNQFMYDTYDPYERLRFNMDDRTHSAAGRIAIVGLPGAGKKTLCNSLWGWNAVQPSEEISRNFGLLTLIDLPLDPYDAAGVLYRLEQTDLIIFMLDGERGLDPDSFNWIARLRGLNAAMLIVLNKADRIPADKLQQAVEYLEARIARPVIPLKAVNPDDVRDGLLVAALKMCPDLAVPLATEITGLRPIVALHTVTQAAMTSLSLSLEMSSLPDSGLLIGLQLRLIREIAAIYGYKERAGLRQRIGLSVMLRSTLNFALAQSARLSQLDQRIGKGAISVLTTFLIGRAAMVVYGAQLPRWIMRFTPQSWRMPHGQATSSGKH